MAGDGVHRVFIRKKRRRVVAYIKRFNGIIYSGMMRYYRVTFKTLCLFYRFDRQIERKQRFFHVVMYIDEYPAVIVIALFYERQTIFYWCKPVDNGEKLFGADGAESEDDFSFTVDEPKNIYITIDIGGVNYAFGDDGLPRSGWISDFGDKRYFDETGAEKTGFIETADGTVYLTDAHTLAVGLQLIDGKAYYFSSEGIMQTGWIDLPAGAAYFGEDGVRQYGWITVDGVKHYLGTNGIAVNGSAVIDGVPYIFADKGIPATGWVTGADGKRYYAEEDGKAKLGWAEIDGKGYYFTETGAMAVSTAVDGYTIDAEGVARCQTAVKVDNLLASTNKTPLGIYSYCVGHYWYSHIEATRTRQQLLNAGWQNLVDYTLVNGSIPQGLLQVLHVQVFPFRHLQIQSVVSKSYR